MLSKPWCFCMTFWEVHVQHQGYGSFTIRYHYHYHHHHHHHHNSTTTSNQRSFVQQSQYIQITPSRSLRLILYVWHNWYFGLYIPQPKPAVSCIDQWQPLHVLLFISKYPVISTVFLIPRVCKGFSRYRQGAQLSIINDRLHFFKVRHVSLKSDWWGT